MSDNLAPHNWTRDGSFDKDDIDDDVDDDDNDADDNDDDDGDDDADGDVMMLMALMALMC